MQFDLRLWKYSKEKDDLICTNNKIWSFLHLDTYWRIGYNMFQGSRFLRLFWLFGITFAVVMVIQFTELPKGSILSSIVSTGKNTLSGKWNFGAKNDSDSGSAGNATSTYFSDGITNEGLESKSNTTSVDDFLGKSNSSDSEDVKDSESSTSVEKARTPKPKVSVENVLEKKEIEEFSSSMGSNASSGSVSGTLTVALTPAVSLLPAASPTTFDLVSPVVLVDPGFSSVHNGIKSEPKTDGEQSPTQRNFISPMPNNFSPQPDFSVLHNLSISEMNELLLQSRSFPHLKPPKWYSNADQELLSAKSHILDAATVAKASGLQAPIYRNISMFQRSYELMEKMLKIYIYKEGERPIFHDSILEGIYASEGWFLKLLESNKQYVTDDPAKAHLFYLPFSSRLLQLTLYKRHSHSRDNLIKYMRHYVDMLAQKYPFWNRTDGEDHFLAACHDWAPAETRGPLRNSLRALCNADIRVGFEIGKDVSLPTTYVRSPQNPVKDIGGQPPSQRPILAFFAGYMHGYVRPVLLDYWGKDPDMRIFARMPHVKGDKNYIQHMKSSKYCICARGYAVNSPRVMESIFYECVPVIISDNYAPPLFEVLNWESFAVFISEKDIPNMKNILISISTEKYIELQKRVKEVQKHFLWHADPVKYDLFHMILHSVWYNRVFRIISP